MLKLHAVYHLTTDDFEEVDRLTDGVLDALHENDTILDPDIAVSMTEQRLEVWMLVATNDPNEALDRSAQALAHAFKEADKSIPASLAAELPDSPMNSCNDEQRDETDKRRHPPKHDPLWRTYDLLRRFGIQHASDLAELCELGIHDVHDHLHELESRGWVAKLGDHDGPWGAI